ncbi:MAG TPA: TraR/DksA family transcriptional regulator [Candidatus Binatia bacterium]|jgi:DnaK suppressor protein|nr:TraR/DksA family transcriptional regulator [Candidatus Binatia bacterium]
MTSKTLHEFTTLLRDQRAARLHGVTGAVADLRALAEEREAEFEEAAQEDRMAGLLSHLDTRGRRAIEDIDAALDRIADETFGMCVDCEEDIPVERLRVIPTAVRCVECASVADRNGRGIAQAHPSALGEPPADVFGDA